MSHPLKNTIHKFISEPNDDFEKIALALFTFQFANNLPYQNYARALGKNPKNVTRWQEIPAIPTDAFKHPALPLTCAPNTPHEVIFKTSGTTTSVRGKHHFPELSTYHHSIISAWTQLGLPQPENAFFLSSPPTESPNSSLINMFGVLNEQLFPKTRHPFLQKSDHLDPEPLIDFISENKSPLILMGTALAFLHLLENHPPIALPIGSHLLETGGYKNSLRDLEKDDLYCQLSQFFEIPSENIINEYSMTELSSQAYTRPWRDRPGHLPQNQRQAHSLPAWCRARVIDPGSGNDLPPGQTGYLVLHDLANLHSVAAIRTQDFAILHDSQNFTLIGRDPAALARGCSLTAEEFHAIKNHSF